MPTQALQGSPPEVAAGGNLGQTRDEDGVGGSRLGATDSTASLVHHVPAGLKPGTRTLRLPENRAPLSSLEGAGGLVSLGLRPLPWSDPEYFRDSEMIIVELSVLNIDGGRGEAVLLEIITGYQTNSQGRL